jgi:hypothetical protein
MTVRVRDTSRLKFARLIDLDGVEHWELPEYPEIPEASDDRRYVVSRSDRIDRLAETFYGVVDLWWVIAIANDLELVPNDLYENQVLRIPSGRRVFTQILRRPSRGLEGR